MSGSSKIKEFSPLPSSWKTVVFLEFPFRNDRFLRTLCKHQVLIEMIFDYWIQKEKQNEGEYETYICVIHQAQLPPPWCNCP